MKRLLARVAVMAFCSAGLVVLAQAPQGGATPGAIPGAPPRPAAGQAPARDAAPKAGTGIIRGRVLTADTGRPLRKTQVRLASAEVREGRLASTDAEGRYEFKDLPAGRFQLTASKAGYAPLQYGQLRAFEAGRPVDVRDGQTIEKIDFSLPRGGAITGRVLDELGEPVVDASVAAMRYQFVQGRRRLAPTGRQVTTNDIGEFRLFGLLPGQYYVSASLRDSLADILTNGLAPAQNDSRSGYASTYYPATTRAAEAERLTLGVGQTVTDIQIQLSPVRTARITGTVRDSDGKIVTTGAVMVLSKDDPSFAPTSPSQIQPDGSFSIGNLSPAAYTVMSVAGNPIGGLMEISTADVVVAGDDVTGVQVSAVKAVTVTGRILPDSSAARPIPLAAMNVVTISANPDVPFVGSPTPVKINDDQSFEMKALPGRAIFRLGGAPGAWVIRTVRVRGEDITESGFDFKANEDISGVEIELTNQPTTLTGAVTDNKGQPTRDYVVVVFTQDRERWTPTTRMINVSRPDQEGRFRIRVPGGNYYGAALDYLEPGEQFDTDFLNKLRDSAVPFVLNSGETKAMDLKIMEHP